MLNKEFKEGVYEWNEALSKVQQFNQEATTNSEKKDYIAIMQP